MILLHVLIALGSILFSSYVLWKPSEKKLKLSYLFIFLTVFTGTYLVVIKPASMVQSCFTGLIYLGVVLSEIFVARYRLSQKIS